jgi:hypothetical protein
MRPDPRQGWRRYLPQLVALAVGLLAVLGVRALLQDDGGDDDPGRTTTTRAEAEPDDEGDAPSTTADAPGEEEDDAGPDLDLGSVALRLDDLPSGWAAAEASPLELCPDADPAQEVRPADSYQVAYTGGPTGPFVGNVVAELPSEDRAEAYLDAASSAIEACSSYELDGNQVEVEPIESDDLGDESVAARISGGGDLPTRGTIHYVRVGRHVVTLVVVAVGDTDAGDVGRDALEAVVDRL